MQRSLLVMLGILCGWLICPLATGADEPEQAPAVPQQVTAQQLHAFGLRVANIRDLLDNHFIYRQEVKQALQTAQSMTGSEVEVRMMVERVTPHEVIVTADLNRTELVLMHAIEPQFGNLGTRRYHGPPSTVRRHFLAKPIGIRIGSEIELAVAAKLRRRDVLLIRGTIQQLPTVIDGTFTPYAAALIADWKVVEVNPEVEDQY